MAEAAWLSEDRLSVEEAADVWACRACAERGVRTMVTKRHRAGVQKGDPLRAWCRVCLVAPDEPLLPAGPAEWVCAETIRELDWP